MLFKKQPLPPIEAAKTYHWPKVINNGQKFTVNINDWQYKVFPSLKTKSFGSWLFQFEGIARTPPLDGLAVCGEFEVIFDSELPRMLGDHWRNVPEDVEGYCFFMQSDDKSITPSVGATLFCQESALDWIYRAFAVGAQSREGVLTLELQVDCPNNEGGEFWAEQWKSEWLRVSSWKIFSGSQLK